jgi:hypothetical protein
MRVYAKVMRPRLKRDARLAKKELQETEGAVAWAEYQARQAASLRRMDELRALRRARERKLEKLLFRCPR